MSATAEEVTTYYQLVVRQDNRGEWRWHVRGPDKEVVLQSGLEACATRGDAVQQGRDTLNNAGVDVWSESIDGISSHELDVPVPRIDPVAEAQAAGLKPADPQATEKAREALAQLEAKRDAAEAPVMAKREAAPDAGTGVDPVEDNPVVAQRKRTRKTVATTEE